MNIHEGKDKITLIEPVHQILVLKSDASKKGSDEPV